MIMYSGIRINVRKYEVTLDDGRRVMREVVDHPGSAAIIPFIAKDEILLIKQYRYAINETIYEIPAGTLDKGETFFECANRELEEETGYKAGILTPLAVIYPSPGILNETMHLYKATNLIKTKTNHQADESIKGIVTMKIKEVVEMIKRGEIKDAKTVCSILITIKK